MKGGSIYNTHFTAIPFNAPNKPGAMIMANFLLSFDAQYSKDKPENWGDFTVLDLGETTLPLSLLEDYAVPEIPSSYLEQLEKGWEENVLRR